MGRAIAHDAHVTASFDFASREALGPQSCILRGLALSRAPQLLADIEKVTAQAPFRHLVTPGGFTMSVAMTNCGPWGWVSDRTGYRYDPADPLSGRAWPPMPASFTTLALEAAREAGFPGCEPDACLINQYARGTKLSLHQDRDEDDLTQPIVSVSLGLPATFLFGGLARTTPTRRYPLHHGDVVVWGGVDRLRFHGVASVRPGVHSATGPRRLNLTFRRVRTTAR